MTRGVARLAGRLVLPQGVVAGWLEFSETIVGLTADPGVSGPIILPGFIDTHLHGGGGGDTMDGAGGVRALARFHLSHGTTTLYPTTMTNPWDAILAALDGVREVQAAADPTLPDIPGVHLEGPFISPQRLGAQPPHTLEPTPAQVDALLACDVIRLVTLAPEMPGVGEAARRFAEAGVRVSVGHTRADAETVATFAQSVREAGGTLGFTHLYNAMGGMAGREPGVVGAALADRDAYSELILDLHHVYPASFLAATHAKPDTLHLITDSVRANGLGDGETELGGQRVFVKDGAATLTDGTIAGSTLTLDRALRNALALGVDLAQASRMLSATPAQYMGLGDRGELSRGKRADIVVLNDDLQVQTVYVAGRKVSGD
ncbi:MAG: N-acetylglucosamine-6-phosphate deacetylase [uncultured Truepera sp.]|uniref:N-acetylglucosamine-6-phosphate deacetylase n=1 Tax=uncultured Truepera sp. TaxID=543023 RepID=A0A6J4VVM5_9DEIN|nr:MAG: N-acetylglucosamine-6-phosphate deacetylase [uncultured Truepera sp.]